MPANTRLPASRLAHVGQSPFIHITQLAKQHQAINLGQGFPDFNCDERLRQLLTEAIEQGHNQYAPMSGTHELLTTIATEQTQLYGKHWDPEKEITVTAGATQALMATLLALVQPGDDVIVLEPCFDSYGPAIELAGGRPVYIQLDSQASFAPDWDRVRQAIGPRTRLLILNFPHNPTGRCLRESDVRALEHIAAESGILLLSDEVYEHIIFDQRQHQSLSRSKRLAEQAIVVSSFGKSLHITGWKVGYVCAAAPIMAQIRKVHQYMVFSVNTPAQYAIAAHLKQPKLWPALAQFYQRKRDIFIQALADSGFQCLPCEGTYFVLADHSRICAQGGMDFIHRLIQDAGVAAMPLSSFYVEAPSLPIVRFCFAKQDDTLRIAAQRLSRLT